MTIKEFLLLQQINKDVIIINKHYVDITGDFNAAMVLNSLVIAFGGANNFVEDENGTTWLVRKREDWWEECRLKPKAFDRCINILHGLKLVDVRVSHYDGKPTTHIWLNVVELMNLLGLVPESGSSKFPIREDGSSQSGNNPIYNNITSSKTRLTGQDTSITSQGPNTTSKTDSLNDNVVISVLSNSKSNSSDDKTSVDLEKSTVDSENAVREVFEYWQKQTGRNRHRLTRTRYDKIKARLKVFSVEELKKAIDGANKNPFYLGENDRGTEYNFPETIFRTDTTTERHIHFKPKNLSQRTGMASGVVTTTEERQNIVVKRF